MDSADANRYDAKDLRGHILDLPDSYIGPTESSVMENAWVCDWPEEEGDKASEPQLVQRNASLCLGLYKIFDEVLVNAADQAIRTRQQQANREKPDIKVTKRIDVTINRVTSVISVVNDGDGIDVVTWKAPDGRKTASGHTEMMVPDLLFGHLLTSGNYKKGEERIVGGRNGYGAKLANVYSERFEVTTLDHRRGLIFRQVWRDNMSETDGHTVSKTRTKKPYTEVSFLPDYKRFGMNTGLDDDHYAFFIKRVIDVAGCTPKDVRVYLNGRLVPCKTLSKYARLYLPEKIKIATMMDDNQNWEVVVAPSPDGQFRQVSFVNGIWTMDGGRHVDHVVTVLCNRMAKALNAKRGKSGYKPSHLRNGMWMFLRCNIVNPSFNSQTKTEMTTPSKKFGSTFEPTEAFLKSALATDIPRQAELLKEFQSKSLSTKTDGKRTSLVTGVDKLDDANFAGTKRWQECTLMLIEGDSAAGFARAGMSELGNNFYGIYPLKGKLLNVRKTSVGELAANKNKEIAELKKILGLQSRAVGPDGAAGNGLNRLRYGRIMIITDQDVDGSHIKGLILNLFEYYWPEALRRGMVVTLITPLVRVMRGKKTLEVFYSESAYDDWRTLQDAKNLKGLSIKYFKGLGTNTAAMAKECFSSEMRKVATLTLTTAEDGDAMDLAFSDLQADRRKEWLDTISHTTPGYFERAEISLSEFVNEELIQFSHASNVRAIPGPDGLKPSQRKALWVVARRKWKPDDEMKVSQLSGIVSAETDYHHGEDSLNAMIILLAQNYPGSNNMHLLRPEGQFGTRSSRAASPRYIFTRPEDVLRRMFVPDDDVLLDLCKSDGQTLEPKVFYPVLPYMMINGASGIGTGYSTFFASHNPAHIAAVIKHVLEDKPCHNMPMVEPWIRGFKGRIGLQVGGGYVVYGTFQRKSAFKVRITEIPCGTQKSKGIEKYQEWLNATFGDHEQPGQKRKRRNQHYHLDKIVKGDRTHTDNNVDLTVTFKEKLPEDDKSVYELLGLVETCSLSNMRFFSPGGRISRCLSVKSFLENWISWRYAMYVRRWDYQKRLMEYELRFLRSRLAFVEAVTNGSFSLMKQPDDVLLRQFRNGPYAPTIESEIVRPRRWTPTQELLAWSGHMFTVDDLEDPYIEAKTDEVSLTKYRYLLSMHAHSFGQDRADQLRRDVQVKTGQLSDLLTSTPRSMWLDDLDELISAWKRQEIS